MHDAVRIALAALDRADGAPAVADVARRLGLSDRRFIEVFRRHVGMTPKRFCRVRRFQRALAASDAAATPDWVCVAARYGYFDQSHLIRDFVEFSGLTPTAYAQQRSGRVKAHHVPFLG
jgi:AraC-like DNA-binding protein